ncbi:MAG: MarR family winged helix-turn-helix transcriptional regulator [Thomasclavelia sp.]|jgi:DNA-binding MarR family transcriptional regulator|nr:MarR family winged helix-turn-helix transcriptional regulator [Thomasclavelia sp.]
MNIQNKIELFNSGWRNLESIYEDYAKEVGMNYTSLHILNLIAVVDECTQSILCERTFLPKQTVNVIVTNFYKKGWIELIEVPTDRRNKTIHLTQKGHEVTDTLIKHIQEAEKKAMETMTSSQSEELIKSINSYGDVFRKELLKK